MSAWVWPAIIGIGGGVFIFVLLLVPILIGQYRRYGRLSVGRVIASSAVAVYGVALVAYTLLPLPGGDLSAWCAAYAVPHPYLVPGHSIDDIVRQTAGLGLTATLTSRVTLQVVLNVVLFVPWGMLVRRMFGWGVWAATASGIVVSIVIELTQYTGIWGLIGCSYRVADIDDVITNSLGALLAPLLLRWVPKPGQLVASRDVPRPVTRRRRLIGMLVDAFLFWVSSAVLFAGWRLVAYIVLGLDRTTAIGGDFWLAKVAPFVMVFVLPALFGSGASLGQRAVWLRGEWVDAEGVPVVTAPLWRRLLRLFLGGGLWGLLVVVSSVPEGWVVGRALLSAIVSRSGAIAGVFVLVSVIGVLASRRARGISYGLSGATVVDSRAG